MTKKILLAGAAAAAFLTTSITVAQNTGSDMNSGDTMGTEANMNATESNNSNNNNSDSAGSGPNTNWQGAGERG